MPGGLYRCGGGYRPDPGCGGMGVAGSLSADGPLAPGQCQCAAGVGERFRSPAGTDGFCVRSAGGREGLRARLY